MELFNIGVPENTGHAISGHKTSGSYYAYAKLTDKHKREALANVLNKLITATPSNKMMQNSTNSEPDDNEDSPNTISKDDEHLSNMDLNNSTQ
ncbi:4125_t:CDS:1, partial [Dentiscutata heterogama]